MQFPVLDFGLVHSGSEPFNCCSGAFTNVFFYALSHRDTRGGGGSLAVKLFLQRDCERLSHAVYHTLKHLWKVDSTLPAILSHWIG